MADTLGIDLGTTAIKVGRFDARGMPIALASRRYHVPDEHAIPVERVLDAVQEVLREVMQTTREREAPAGIGIASQVNSFALIDEHGRPLSDLFLWTGNWADAEAERLHDSLALETMQTATGMTRLTGQLMLPKCLHLSERESQVWQEASGIRQLADLVTLDLTGEHVTSPGLWSLTGLYDFARQCWWPEALDRLGISPDTLPPLQPAGNVAGRLRKSIAVELALPAGIPVAVGTLDHLAGMIGAGHIQPGMGTLSLGTATCVVVTHAMRPPAMSEGVIGRHPANTDHWYALTWSGLGTLAPEQCRQQVAAETPLSELMAIACSHPVPAPDSPAHGMRVVVEQINTEIRRLLEHACAESSLEFLAVIGGGAQSDAWMQMLADELRIPLLRPASVEAAAAGAARLGAYAAKRIPSLDQLQTAEGTTFLPKG